MAGYTPGEIRKTLVAVAGFAATAASLALAQGDVIPEAWAKWAVLLVTLSTTYGVFKAPNDDLPALNRVRAHSPIPGDSEPSDEQLGKHAYEAYLASTGGVSAVTGAVLPSWQDNTHQIRVAWVQAAREVKGQVLS